MPAITAQQRSDLVLLVNGVFGAAPTSRVLSNLVKLVEEGNSVDQVATMLTNNTNFESIYAPALLTSEFATQFAANLLGAAATTETTARVEALVTTYLNAGDTRTEAVWKVTKLLSETEDADFATAKAQLNNKADVSLAFALDTQYTQLLTLEQLQSVIANVTSDEATVTAAKAAVAAGTAVSGSSTGETFTLTAGVDTITGTAKNDSITAILDGTPADQTMNGLDTIDGGEGTDVLNILDQDGGQALPTTLQMSNVETVNVRAAGAATIDLTSAAGVTGVTTLNSTQSTSATLVAAATTDVNVSGATGAIDVAGGKNVTVTDSTADMDIDVGEAGTGTTNAAGTITVTDSNQGSGDIDIDGGTTVTLTASGVTTGATVIGANDAASGAVTVTATAADRNDNADLTMGSIQVTGGTSVNVTVSAGSTDASEFATGTTITQSAVTVNGDDSTTSVTIAQDAAVAEDTYTAATAGVAQVKTVKFVAMTANSTMTVDSLVFTAAKALTAAEVAAAFASMAASETQTAGGKVANGTFTVASSANWTSSAANGDTVTFTEVTPTTADTTLTAVYSAGTDPVVTEVTAGVTAVDLNAGVLGVTGGAAVVVDQDGADATITTITLDGYGAGSDIQGADALTTLSLSNSAQGIDVDAAVETLTVNLDNISGGAVLDLDDDGGASNATLKTVNVVLASSSTADIIADAATDLNVSGTGTLTTSATATDLALLDTVTVSGAAGLVLTGTDATVLANIDASGTSGNVTATIDSGIAAADTVAYSGGTGTDTVTLTADATVDGDISLGDGDDKLTLTASTTAISGTVSGGAGTDTISMDTTSAESLDDVNDLTNLSGFERLELTAAADAESIDADTMGFNHVTVVGVADAGAAEVDNFTLIMANSSTVALTAAIGDATENDELTVSVTDAATTDATLNVETIVSTADINFSELVVADVETINITATDSNVDEDSDGVEYETGDRDLSTLDLDAAEVTSVVISGNSNLSLDMTGNTAATTINASAFTGNLTITSYADSATVTGGSGDDALTASGDSNVLLGGDGNDTLTVAAGADLTTLTGGAGNDTFVFNVPTTVNDYSTITDLSSGDIIDLADGATFQAAAIVKGDTAVFQDFANAATAVDGGAANDAAWFQFAGNTYIVVDVNGNEGDFENGTDSVIKITGLVDLSTASYNQTDGTLEIA